MMKLRKAAKVATIKTRKLLKGNYDCSTAVKSFFGSFAVSFCISFIYYLVVFTVAKKYQ